MLQLTGSWLRLNCGDICEATLERYRGARALSVWAKITDWPSSGPDSDSSSVTLVAASSSTLDADSVGGPCSIPSCCISTRVANWLLGFDASLVPGGDLQVVAIALYLKLRIATKWSHHGAHWELKHQVHRSLEDTYAKLILRTTRITMCS